MSDHPALRGSLVVVEQVCCQMPGEQPFATESRFMRTLATREQPYIRRMTVFASWQPLDLGWITRASAMVLSHGQGRVLLVQPTEEERDAMDSAVVEVAFVHDAEVPKGRTMFSEALLKSPVVASFSIPLGESVRIPSPSDLTAVRVRCVGGDAKLMLTLFPE